MVVAWILTVRNNDTVIHLGDFAHHHPDDTLPKLFASLNGRKHLIRGNHDRAETLALPWESQRDVMYASIDNQNVVLAHYAWRQWPKIRKGALMLYGHSHGRLPGNTQSCDIGVDVMGFAPVRLNTIKEHLATLPLMVEPEARNDIEDLGNGGLKP
jgi:calcineurin-like phosphoesterase family protein